MAVDTAAKRASSAGDWLEQHIIPDGTLDQGDRQTIAGDYGGILAETIVLLVVCFVNLKSVVKEDLNLKSVVSNAANLLSAVRNDINLKSAPQTEINLKSEVC